MKKVIISIGIPRSGKSTFLKKYATDKQFEYICVDDIREEISGDASNQTVNAEAWDLAYSRLKDFLSQKKSVVFDSTMVGKRSRAEIISVIRKNSNKDEYLIKAVVFNTPLEVAKERNGGRDKVVPEDVLERQNQTLYRDRPLAIEGFDTLQTFEDFVKTENLKESSAEISGPKLR